MTQPEYNAYAHQSGTAAYDESQLLAVDGNYVATANAMVRTAPFGQIVGSVQPGTAYHVVGESSDCMWYKISGQVTGYVYDEYMEAVGQ